MKKRISQIYNEQQTKTAKSLYSSISGAMMILPNALALGAMAGTGVQSGLFGALFFCIFASFIGSGLFILAGPTITSVFVVSSLMTALNGNIQALWAALFLTGFLQILLSFTKIPSLVKHIPRPAISGFLAGIGVIVIIIQIAPLVGLRALPSAIETIKSLGYILTNMNQEALIIGLLTIWVLIYTPKWLQKIIPAEFLAILASVGICAYYKIDIPTIEGFKGHLPSIVLGDFSNLAQMLPMTFAAACICLITSVVGKSKINPEIKSKRLIFTHGLVNAVGALFGGVLGTTNVSTSKYMVKNGARTRFCAIIAGILLIPFIKFGYNFLNHIPVTVLAAILVKLGLQAIDFEFIRNFKKVKKEDLVAMILIFGLMFFYGITVAFYGAVTISALLFAKKQLEGNDPSNS